MEVTIFNQIVTNQQNASKRKTLMLRNIESVLIANNIIDSESDSVRYFRNVVSIDLLKMIHAYEDDVRLDSDSRMRDTLTLNQMKFHHSSDQLLELKI